MQHLSPPTRQPLVATCTAPSQNQKHQPDSPNRDHRRLKLHQLATGTFGRVPCIRGNARTCRGCCVSYLPAVVGHRLRGFPCAQRGPALSAHTATSILISAVLKSTRVATLDLQSTTPLLGRLQRARRNTYETSSSVAGKIVTCRASLDLPSACQTD